jgi:hypothetical protein
VRVDRTGTETFIGLFASKVNKPNQTKWDVRAASFGKETSNSRFPTFENLRNGMNDISKMSKNIVQLDKQCVLRIVALVGCRSFLGSLYPQTRSLISCRISVRVSVAEAMKLLAYLISCPFLKNLLNILDENTTSAQ